jgi:fused signal recognition particle receptor
VAYDTLRAAQARGADLAIIDTAGRLQNKVNLMLELQKIRRVVEREYPGAPHEVWLVIDATTGQNGLSQARIFMDSVKVTGIVLTKLDGTAKGGIALSIYHELGIPIRYVGVGETAQDLLPFNPGDYVRAILDEDNAPSD